MAQTSILPSATSVDQSTSTYKSVVVTSFPFNPLTETFSAPSDCSGFYEPGNYMIDPMTTCLPPGHNKLETAYFSPGYVCPSGYLTAKVDNKGVNSITTVTCCPARSDIILSAVDPATLAGPWINLFCTWIAPSFTTLDITQTTEGRTWTEQAPFESPGGLNAFGIRMVYQQSDLEAAAKITSVTVGGPANSSVVVHAAESATGGLSTGAAVAIAAVVPVVTLALLAGALFWWWKKKEQQKQQDYSKVDEVGSPRTGPTNPPMPSMSPPPSTMQSGTIYDMSHAQSQYQSQYQSHQLPHMASTQSLQSSTMGSTQRPPAEPYALHYGQSGAYVSYAQYKHGDAATPITLHSTPSPPPPPPPLQQQVQTSELAAVVPQELAHEYRPSAGRHIDDQKIRGMPPL